MKIIIFSSPGRGDMLRALRSELKGLDVTVINDPATFGKQNFWKRYKEAFEICKASKHNNFMFLPDDVSKIDLTTIKKLFARFENTPFICSVVSDGRYSCWGSVPNLNNSFDFNGYTFDDLGFYDCGGITNRETIKNVIIDKVPPNWFDRKGKSSGVGYQLTQKFKALGVPMFVTKPSLSFHGDHVSVMHKEERKKTRLVSRTKDLKTVVGIATFEGREKYLEKTIESLDGQADEIVIYNNEFLEDHADNSKFYELTNLKYDCYFLSCDDDIIYPPNYVAEMVAAIDRTGTIVTHHGRKLLGLDRSYYKGHEAHHCGRLNNVEKVIDVAGTGVTGFHTSYFKPTNVFKSEFLKMSDLVFSLEAAKQKKVITLLSHPENYFKIQEVPINQTIYGMEVNKEEQQIKHANEIFKLNYNV